MLIQQLLFEWLLSSKNSESFVFVAQNKQLNYTFVAIVD